MKLGRELTSLIIALFISACSETINNEPGIDDEFRHGLSSAFDYEILKKIEGKYSVHTNNSYLGKTVFVKVNNNSISLFCENYNLVILKASKKDTNIILYGKSKNPNNSDIKLVKLSLKYGSNWSQIYSDTSLNAPVHFIGFCGNSPSALYKEINLKRDNYIQLFQYRFSIIGHRGGGSSGGSFSAPENSFEILSYVEQYGANAVEIDIQLTKDNIPIVYHDNNFNPRLIRGEFLIGPVSNYYLSHIRSFGSLHNGEKIPTLNEMLEYIILNTNINLVWIDVKTANALLAALPLQKKFIDLADSYNRDIEILIGLAYDETYNAYLKYGGTEYPSLCELSLDKVRTSDSRIWAPRWTLGSLKNEISIMHSEGRRVFFWTVDDSRFIKTILNDGKANGILTNYPQIVAYEYFSTL